jgi:hypothetical protein
MNKGLEALQKLRDLVEYLTRIDYVPRDLRDEVKELLIKSYKDSNGYFSQIEEALKRNEPMKPNYGGKFPQCPVCKRLLHSIWQKYCDNCAQAIDWEDGLVRGKEDEQNNL